MSRMWHSLVVLLILVFATSMVASAAERLPRELEGVEIVEHLGEPVPAELDFTDHNGKQVRLGDYWSEGEPVLLTLNYYRCTMLCSLQLNELVASLKEAELVPGDGWRAVTISIDEREGTELAAAKRAGYTKMLGHEDAQWDFLTGSKENIDAIAGAVGFGFKYLPEQDEFAHPAVFYMISPDGILTRYIYGLTFPARDLKFAIIEAGQGTVGTLAERILLTCFHFDPQNGRYSPFAFGMVRAGGVITMAFLGMLFFAMWRYEKRHPHSTEAST